MLQKTVGIRYTCRALWGGRPEWKDIKRWFYPIDTAVSDLSLSWRSETTKQHRYNQTHIQKILKGWIYLHYIYIFIYTQTHVFRLQHAPILDGARQLCPDSGGVDPRRCWCCNAQQACWQRAIYSLCLPGLCSFDSFWCRDLHKFFESWSVRVTCEWTLKIFKSWFWTHRWFVLALADQRPGKDCGCFEEDWRSIPLWSNSRDLRAWHMACGELLAPYIKL